VHASGVNRTWTRPGRYHRRDSTPRPLCNVSGAALLTLRRGSPGTGRWRSGRREAPEPRGACWPDRNHGPSRTRMLSNAGLSTPSAADRCSSCSRARATAHSSAFAQRSSRGAAGTPDCPNSSGAQQIFGATRTTGFRRSAGRWFVGRLQAPSPWSASSSFAPRRNSGNGSGFRAYRSLMGEKQRPVHTARRPLLVVRRTRFGRGTGDARLSGQRGSPLTRALVARNAVLGACRCRRTLR
jgi:hypothetical protein